MNVDETLAFLARLEAHDARTEAGFREMMRRRGRVGFEAAVTVIAQTLGEDEGARARRLFTPLVHFDVTTPATAGGTNRRARRTEAARKRKGATS